MARANSDPVKKRAGENSINVRTLFPHFHCFSFALVQSLLICRM